MYKCYVRPLYALPLLAALFLPQDAMADLTKAEPRNALEAKFLRCLRTMYKVDRIPLTPQHEALVLAEYRDLQATSPINDQIFSALDSERAQKIRSEGNANALRKYGCTLSRTRRSSLQLS
jgi:hypothetical protein